MALTSSPRPRLIDLFLENGRSSIQPNGYLKETLADLMDSNFGEGVDRISGLPDHIICHILSFLPTKNAVASSILSTRWKYLWTSVPILDIDARLRGGYCPNINMNVNRGSEVAFRNFVSRVLLLNDIPHIQKLRLIYECHYSLAPLCTWLHTAITRNIQELELDFLMSVRDTFVQLPRKIFTSHSLVVLKLSCMSLEVPSIVCFPRLRILELKRITYLDDQCSQTLLSGCHVLEELVIEETVRENPRVVHICIDTLKRFSFSYKFVVNMTVDCPYKFVINAPKLEYFHVKGRISDDYDVESLASLINAHVDLRKTAVSPDNYSVCCQRLCKLFNGISNVKFLTLSYDIVQIFAGHNQKLPRFNKLTNLAFGVGIDFCWRRIVTAFIKCSPELDVLNLNNKLGLLRDIDELKKTPAQPMPEYMRSRMKEILIDELYVNFKPETVEYLLQDVNILKRLKMNCQCPIMLRTQLGHSYLLNNVFA